MTLWQQKKWIKYTGFTFASLFILFIAFVSSFFILLSQGPIDLKFLKPHLAKFYDGHADAELDFDSLVLSWDGFAQPLSLEAKNFKWVSSHNAVKRLYIPHALLKFKLHQLLVLRTIPRETFLTAPEIEYDLSKVRAKPTQTLEAHLKSIHRTLHEVLSFKRLMIDDAKVLIVPSDTRAPVMIQGHIHLMRKGRLFQGELQGESAKDSSKFSGYIRFDCNTKQTYVRLMSDHVNSAVLMALDPSLQALPIKFESLSGQVKLLHSLQSGFEAGKVEISVNHLQSTNNTYVDQSLSFPTLYLKASFVDDQVALNQLTVPFKEAVMSCQGVGHWQSQSLTFNTVTTLTQLAINDIEPLWPRQYAEDARMWITENISNGMVPKAYLNFDGTYDVKNSKLQLKTLNGSIEILNARINYIDTMPKIEQVKAVADFDHDHFDIKIKSGKCNHLNVNGGSVVIGKFSDPTTELKLDVDIQGNLSDVLFLINYRPLEYASQFNLVPAKTSGNVKAHLVMSFPLKLPFDPGWISTQVNASVDKGIMKQVVGLPVDLHGGALEVTVNDEKVTIKGKGFLNGSSSTLMVEKFLPAANNPLKERCEIKIDLLPASLKDFGFTLTNAVHGSVPTEISFKNSQQNDGSLTIKADLTQCHIKAFNFEKPKQQKGFLSSQVILKDYTFVEIPKFEIKSTSEISVHGNATFAKGFNNLSSAAITQMKVGNSEMKVSISRSSADEYQIDLKAKTLDLTQYLEQHAGEEALNFNNATPIRINFHADRLKLGGSKDLFANEMTARIEQGLVKEMTFNGSLDAVKPSKNLVELTIKPLPNNMRKLHLKTDQAGELFRTLGILENVRKGKLRLVAVHDDYAPRSSWEGKLTMKDYSLLNAPFLSHFVSLVFPTGLADLSKGGGLGFNYLKARFIARPKTIVISEGRAYGYSLGFSFGGNFAREKEGRVNMQGSVIPAYFLNTLISKIPLLGELISGGKHEGLFGVSFQITGSKEDPQILVNPLSALTPGLLRKIFSPFESEDTLDTEVKNDEHEMIDDNDKDLSFEDGTERMPE